MKTYIRKEDKHEVLATLIDSSRKDGYIVVDDDKIICWEEKEMFEDLYEEKDPDADTILDKNVEDMLDSAYTESKPKIIITDNTLQDEKALEYYNENCKGKFEASVLPLLIYLAKEHHPMTKVIVESNKAELVEGVKSVVNNNFIED